MTYASNTVITYYFLILIVFIDCTFNIFIIAVAFLLDGIGILWLGLVLLSLCILATLILTRIVMKRESGMITAADPQGI